MSIPNPLVLFSETANGNVNFVPTSFPSLVQPGGVTRIREGSTLVVPELIAIRHGAVSAKNVGPVDRTNGFYSLTVLDADGKPHALTVNLTVNRSRGGAFTNAQVSNALGLLVETDNGTAGLFRAYLADLMLGGV